MQRARSTFGIMNTSQDYLDMQYAVPDNVMNLGGVSINGSHFTSVLEELQHCTPSAHIIFVDTKAQLSVVSSFASSTWTRGSHPRPPLHTLIASLILCLMTQLRGAYLETAVEPETASLSVYLLLPRTTTVSPAPPTTATPDPDSVIVVCKTISKVTLSTKPLQGGMLAAC